MSASESEWVPKGWPNREMYLRALDGYCTKAYGGAQTPAAINYKNQILSAVPPSINPVAQGSSISSCCGVSWNHTLPSAGPGFIIPKFLGKDEPIPKLTEGAEHILIRDGDKNLLILWNDS